jgi:hypothetical protein
MQKAEEYRDRYPCLKFRKQIMKIQLLIHIACNKIISTTIFETVTILVIVANSFVLALEDPTAEDQSPLFKVIDDVFLVCYTVEMVLKIIGLGFIMGKGAYIRDSWNILDFVIVMSAYVSLLQSGGGANLSVLRSFRVLRPLRTISSVEGLKLLVTALLSALPLLRDAIIIVLFFFFIFAIAGLQLISGYLKRRCVNTETGIINEEQLLCGGSGECPAGDFCGKRNENPNYGATNFDTVFYSLLAVFQSVTLEGWSLIMVDVQLVLSPWMVFFFLPLVFIGAFFLLNLTLAVINAKFNEAHQKHKQSWIKPRPFKAAFEGDQVIIAQKYTKKFI